MRPSLPQSGTSVAAKGSTSERKIRLQASVCLLNILTRWGREVRLQTESKATVFSPQENISMTRRTSRAPQTTAPQFIVSASASRSLHHGGGGSYQLGLPMCSPSLHW